MLIIATMAAAFGPAGRMTASKTTMAMPWDQRLRPHWSPGSSYHDQTPLRPEGHQHGAAAEYMAYQFKYDTIHGRWDGSLEVDGDDLIIDGQRVKTTHSRKPEEIGWEKLGVDYLCESTGVFLTAESAKPHVDAGIKKVIFLPLPRTTLPS